MFTLWDQIPPDTALSDLFTTSLLVLTEDQGSGVLMRCSPGFEDGSVTVVHADTTRPNALRMFGADEDAQIGAEAQALGVSPPVRVVAIPHITWKHPGKGVPWRTPATIVAVLAASLPVTMLNPPWSVVVALPVAAVVGSLMWLLLRGRVATRITPVGDLQPSVATIVEYAWAHVQKVEADLTTSPAPGIEPSPDSCGPHIQ